MRVTQEILAALSTAEVTGKNVRLTDQLDHALYTKVNKMLEAVGGKWDRRAKAHVFTEDAGPLLDVVITTGEVTTARDVGFFETPKDLARRLVALANVGKGDHCLEPSAGLGRIVRAMADAGAGRVSFCERDPKRADHVFESLVARGTSVFRFTEDDWLDVPVELFTSRPPIDRVVMNPPFTKVGAGDHLDHVRHAFEALRVGGVLVSVLPYSVTFRRDKRHTAFSEWVRSAGGTIEPLPVDSFKESGTGVRTVVLRAVKQR